MDIATNEDRTVIGALEHRIAELEGEKSDLVDRLARLAADNENLRRGTIRKALEAESDERLQELADRTKELLSARKNKRRNDALVQIRRIAKDHGLDVAVKQPGRKRGRPRKVLAA